MCFQISMSAIRSTEQITNINASLLLKPLSFNICNWKNVVHTMAIKL